MALLFEFLHQIHKHTQLHEHAPEFGLASSDLLLHEHIEAPRRARGQCSNGRTGSIPVGSGANLAQGRVLGDRQ
eukprot:5455585-Pleurochrysis_carterae.AAC.2